MAENTIKETLESVSEYIGEQIDDKKEDRFKVESMPVASIDYVGKIYQFVGETTADYTHGYSYECKAQGTDPETYEWENVLTQDTSEGDSRIQSEIVKIGVEQEGNVFSPYIIFKYNILPIEYLTWSQIMSAANDYYNGDIPIEEFQAQWEIGSSKVVDIDGSDVVMKLVDINKTPLATSVGEITKALATFHMENPFATKRVMHNLAISGGRAWSETYLRAWCNSDCYNSIESDVKSGIKSIICEWATDKIFIPSVSDITDATNAYQYYQTATNRIKNASYWTSTRDGSHTPPQAYITTEGAVAWNYQYYANGVAIAFSI